MVRHAGFSFHDTPELLDDLAAVKDAGYEPGMKAFNVEK